MATFGDIVVWTKQLLNKTPATWADDTGAPKNAVIKAAINQARSMLYARFAAQYPARFTSVTDVTYTANATSITLPTAAQRRTIVSLFGYLEDISNPFAIACRPYQELANMPNSGIPAAYAVDSTRLYLRPIPAVDQPLRLAYVSALTALSAESDEPSEFPAEFHLLLGTKAAHMILQRNNDPEADGLKEMVKEGEELLNDTLRSTVQDDSMAHSAPEGPFNGAYW